MRHVVFAVVFLLWAIPCGARIITVDDDGPADFNNIQAAINDSDDGDIVEVYPGTYTGEGAYDIDFGGRAITVRSTDPNDPCVVAETIIDRGNFRFAGGEGPNSVVDGLTISRTTGQGQGIECRQSSPTIRNCVIVDGPYGGMYLRDSSAFVSDCTITGCSFLGGICCAGGDVNATITDCVVSNNTGGGGISCYDYGGPSSILELNGCTITGNSTDYDGGGICWGESIGGSITLTITDCNISGNSADGKGGGIYCDAAGASNLTITNSTVSGNSAAGDGGGVNCGEEITTTIANCSLTGNTAEGSGGGIHCDDTGGPFSLTITNSTISGNSAAENGGGICSGRETGATVTNCRISANRAGIEGGGLCVYLPSQFYAAAENCIISGNWTGGIGGGVVGYRSISNCTITGNFAEVDGGVFMCMEVKNSIIWGNVGGQIWFAVVVYSDVEGGWSGLGNIDEDPCFVEPGKWVDVNDPNIIVEPNDPNAIWIDGDYHLKSEGWRWDVIHEPPRWGYDYVTSRCIDAGNPGSTLDEELLSIPGDPCNVYGENLRINMGAYGGTAEASMPPYDWALLSDITNDGITDFVDFAYLADMYTDQDDELPADFDRDGDIDYDDLSLLVDNWLGQTTWYE